MTAYLVTKDAKASCKDGPAPPAPPINNATPKDAIAEVKICGSAVVASDAKWGVECPNTNKICTKSDILTSGASEKIRIKGKSAVLATAAGSFISVCEPGQAKVKAK